MTLVRVFPEALRIKPRFRAMGCVPLYTLGQLTACLPQTRKFPKFLGPRLLPTLSCSFPQDASPCSHCQCQAVGHLALQGCGAACPSRVAPLLL